MSSNRRANATPTKRTSRKYKAGPKPRTGLPTERLKTTFRVVDIMPKWKPPYIVATIIFWIGLTRTT